MVETAAEAAKTNAASASDTSLRLSSGQYLRSIRRLQRELKGILRDSPGHAPDAAAPVAESSGSARDAGREGGVDRIEVFLKALRELIPTPPDDKGDEEVEEGDDDEVEDAGEDEDGEQEEEEAGED